MNTLSVDAHKVFKENGQKSLRDQLREQKLEQNRKVKLDLKYNYQEVELDQILVELDSIHQVFQSTLK